MTEVGYRHLLDKLCREGFGDGSSTVNIMRTNQAFDWPDGGMMRTSLGSRCVIVIEGEREILNPIYWEIERMVREAMQEHA